MSMTGAIISGSFALQFFERVNWKDSDLDVFVEYTEKANAIISGGFTALCHYVETVEGYKYKSDSTGSDAYENTKDLEEVFKAPIKSESHPNKIKIRTYMKDGKKIQIIGTKRLPAQAIIRDFYATMVVNIITGTSSYGVYPRPTFIEHKGYMLLQLDEYRRKLLKKYARRGWAVKEVMGAEDEYPNSPIRSHRRICDKYTWKIPLGNFVGETAIPDSVLELSTFRIFAPSEQSRSENENENENSYYSVRAEMFQAQVLRHRYLVRDYDWMDGLATHTNSLCKTELRKLCSEDRPDHYDEKLQRPEMWYNLMIQKPDYWTYWDDSLPFWLASWEKKEIRSGAFVALDRRTI